VSGDASKPGPARQTAADYVTIVLSPVLIVGLVGSLVFFLLEVLYTAGGQWKDRLQWILFFYVFGTVLAARVSMNGDTSSRAPLYGGVLAVLTYIGMQSFVEYPPGARELSFLVNLLLVGLVWWCAHRLTWDCTNVDENAEMSGEGLLQAAGLDEGGPGAPPEESPEEEDPPARPPTWWERYQRYRRQKEKKRVLGVWVVYFSLAALPLFGLGQAFIPLAEPGRRRFAFWLMTVYVGCGLGLLLTTSFLGLRRYLRQKRLQMPAAMTGAWMGAGGGLIALLLLAGALLPRPYAEYPLLDLVKPAGSAQRKANRLAFKGDSPAEGKGQAGAAKPGQKGEGNQAGEKGQGEGEKDGKGGQGKDGKDKSGGAGGKEKGEQGGGEKGEEGKDGKGKQGEKADGGEKGEKGKQGGRAGDPGKAAKGMKDMHAQDGSSRPSSPRLAQVQQWVQRLAPVLKWVVFVLLGLLVLVALLRGGLGFLSNFTTWAKRLLEAWRTFWANLFGGKKGESGGAEEGVGAEGAAAERFVPFHSFRNPFASGKAARTPVRELVRYTFAALEAWARERDLGRGKDETALEFVGRLGEEVPALEAEARALAQLHARAEYAREAMPAGAAEALRAFWERLERVVEAPLSA
jgi:hypothetical protein